jgi:hypothetical protein
VGIGEVNKDLNFYLGGIGTFFQEIEDLVADTPDGDPGWSIIVDGDRIPAKGLDWLAQFVGIRIDYGIDTDPRQQVKSHDNWGRGTPQSMIGPASHWLPDGTRMYVSERNPTPYHAMFIFVTGPVQTLIYQDLYVLYPSYHKIRLDFPTYADIYDGTQGDLDRVQEVVVENKPAGIQIGFLFTDTTLYMAVYILYDSYQQVYNTYATYEQLYSEPFPDIDIATPLYQQLKSSRYYRNLYNQFASYQEVYETYMTY